jgi:hypothetical protein
MTFEQGLIASGYYFQPHTGAFCKEDSNDNLHSYVEQEDGEWSYEKYDQDDQLVTTKVFSLNQCNQCQF